MRVISSMGHAGDLIKSLRTQNMATRPVASALAMAAANNFGIVAKLVPLLLNTITVLHHMLGSWPLEAVSNGLNGATGRWMPVWNAHFPRGAAKLKKTPFAPELTVTGASNIPRKVRCKPDHPSFRFKLFE